MTSMPRSRASRTTSEARMPVSTLTISVMPMAGGALDDVGAHSVTVLQTMRNVEAGFAACHFDGFLQNDHRDGAVDVVIAVDQDFFVCLGWRL